MYLVIGFGNASGNTLALSLVPTLRMVTRKMGATFKRLKCYCV
jgi:hypothetical protein